MSLLQIHEPGQTPLPHEEEDNIVVGIDLGTTHSLVAISRESKPEIIRDVDGNMLHPSVVHYLDGTITTGYHAQEKAGGACLSSVKRLLGREVADIKKTSGAIPYPIAANYEGGVIRLDVGGEEVTPVEVSAEILKSLKVQAERALKQEVTRVVITVPAYFDDAARQATKYAAQLAGLEVMRLVNEPTAAALAYGLDQGKEGTYAVYDLGGGTFDISILKMTKGVFKVLSTAGNTSLGGDDFDREMAEIFLWDFKHKTGRAPQLQPDELAVILRQAKDAKEYLTEHKTGVFDVFVQEQMLEVNVERDAFNQVIAPFVEMSLDAVRQALADANLEPEEIDGVVLVGGSTRVPLVQQKVAEFFGQDKVLRSIDPDIVVAEGAALQAEGLSGASSNLLLDVIPLSLGLETMGGIVEKVIHRNTPIPVSKTQEFTTYQDGQTGMQIHVVQGEREMVSQNRSLAKFELIGIPSMVAGAARVKVIFTVDADGLLTVSAREETTGVRQTVEVKPSYGLAPKQIQHMLRDSMQHARSDMEERLLQEARVEAERIIHSVENAVKVDGTLLSDEEKQSIKDAVNSLQQILESSDRDAIVIQTETLIKNTESFAAKRIDKHAAKSLRGKHVKEVV